MEDGLSENEALKLARKAVEDRKDSMIYPGGQSSGMSRVIGTHLRPHFCDTKNEDFKSKCKGSYLYYRSLDGICNNLQKPLYGAACTPFIRKVEHTTWKPKSIKQNLEKLSFLRPCVPRKSSQAPEFLPSARLVSTTIHKDRNSQDDVATHMVTQFGQFIDHDITLTPEVEEPTDCCSNTEHENCFSITIPSDDSFYSNLKQPQKCLPFHRSLKFCEEKGIVYSLSFI